MTNDSTRYPRPALSREATAVWVATAQAARLNADVLEHIGPPLEGCSLHSPSSEGALDNVADWCNGYLNWPEITSVDRHRRRD